MATRKLRITNCTEVFKGTGAKGDYTIYEVEAVDANTGVMVNVPLRSFEHLDMDEVAEFDVQAYERPGKPTTYTLKKPRGTGGGNSLGPKVDKLRERIELLEGNVQTLQTNLSDVMRRLNQSAEPVAAGTSIHTQSPSTSFGSGVAGPADDDIPF